MATVTTGNYSQISAADDAALKRKELEYGTGIVLLGGLIGFAYGYFNGNKTTNNTTGTTSTSVELKDAFAGLLIGIIIALVVILLYRAVIRDSAIERVSRSVKTQVYNASLPGGPTARTY